MKKVYLFALIGVIGAAAAFNACKKDNKDEDKDVYKPEAGLSRSAILDLINDANTALKAEKKFTITEDEVLQGLYTKTRKNIMAYDVDERKYKHVEYENGNPYYFLYQDDDKEYRYNVSSGDKTLFTSSSLSFGYKYDYLTTVSSPYHEVGNWNVEGSKLVGTIKYSGEPVTYKVTLTTDKKYKLVEEFAVYDVSKSTTTTTFAYGVADVSWPSEMGKKEDYVKSGY